MTSETFTYLADVNFNRAVDKAHWRDWLSWVFNKNNDLIAFEDIRYALPLKGQRYLGFQSVPLDHIVGSEGHPRDFDRAFFPRHPHLKSRWVSIDTAHYKSVVLPPVELIKIDEVYFVRDGNHRISVARTRGQEFIDAYIMEIDAPISLKIADLKR